MQDRLSVLSGGRACVAVLACAVATLAVPRPAAAQYFAPPLTNTAIGEDYHIEVSGNLWKPALEGTISSEEFGLQGTPLDFLTDLGFEHTRFRDLRIVLRPARKHRLRAEYTPIAYIGSSVLSRSVVFNGIQFNATLPVTSEFDWKVWRLGYEYDMVYRSRGFVGAFVEARRTEFYATLAGGGRSEFTSATAPLPAVGVAARGYVTRNVAINFDLSVFRIPTIEDKYQGNYYDWDLNGTVNLTNNVGVQVGWRRMTTYLDINRDHGDFSFQGLWVGGALRY
jgi:hypothetical protein